MGLKTCLVLLTVFCCAFGSEGDEVVKIEEKEESREGKQLRETIEHEGWRVVGAQEWQNPSGWIPRDNPGLSTAEDATTNRPLLRRRRIRKRKRRPRPQVLLTSEEADEEPQRRRRVRPQTLEEANESWSEIEEESFRRPYNRRRITPVYVPEEVRPLTAVLNVEEEKPSQPLVYERVRDPFTALREAEEKAQQRKKQETVQETTTAANLKALLKQSGGSLSLSEILQKKNLSLNDLLQGKQQAISALTERPEEYYAESEAAPTTILIYPTEKLAVTESSLPENGINGSNEDSTEKVEGKRKRLEGLYVNEERKGFPEVKKVEVVTEPTTERRIFVPSHPKYYTAFNYKPNMVKNKPKEVQIKPTEKTSSTTWAIPNAVNASKHVLGNKYLDFRSKYVSMKPRVKVGLPLTSAKLNRGSKKPEVTEPIATTTALPSQAFKIELKDLFGISEVTTAVPVKEARSNATKEVVEEGPFKMIIDIDGLVAKNSSEPLRIDLLESSTYEVAKEMENEVESSTKVEEKAKLTSAREEIMEILRDHVTRQNLSRILEMRNMTVEELVAQRERGSSQLHLADIFHNRTREPEPPSEPYVGHIAHIPLAYFDRKAKTIANPFEAKKDSEGSDYFASVVDVKPLDFSKVEPRTKSKEVYTVTSFPTYKIEMEKIIKENQPPPFQLSVWKSLYPNIFAGNAEDANRKEAGVKAEEKVEDVLHNEIKRVEEIENSISDAVKDRFNIDYEEEEQSAYSKLPSGVKSAIIASAAIVGISLVVFLTIFIGFKWSQRQKKRLCYSGSFSCSRIKSPILENVPKRTIRTIVCETLGRKRKYSNAYPQSMSDYMWENDKKPFQ